MRISEYQCAIDGFKKLSRITQILLIISLFVNKFNAQIPAENENLSPTPQFYDTISYQIYNLSCAQQLDHIATRDSYDALCNMTRIVEEYAETAHRQLLNQDTAFYGSSISGKVFLSEDYMVKEVERCACHLISFSSSLWSKYVDENVRRVAVAVVQRRMEESPEPVPYLWSDFELGTLKMSPIATSKAYIRKKKSRQKHPDHEALVSDKLWESVEKACEKLALDKEGLLVRLDELNKFASFSFMSQFLIFGNSTDFRTVYEAARACKLLHLYASHSSMEDSIYDWDDEELIDENNDGVDDKKESSSDQTSAANNQISESTLVFVFRDCSNKFGPLLTDEHLFNLCPMFKSSNAQKFSSWLRRVKRDQKYKDPIRQLNIISVRCACQILLRTNTWEQITQFGNIKLVVDAFNFWLSNRETVKKKQIEDKKEVWTIKESLNSILRDLTLDKLIEAVVKVGHRDLSSADDDDSDRLVKQTQVSENDLTYPLTKQLREKSALRISRVCKQITNIDGANLDWEEQLKQVRALDFLNEISLNKQDFIFYVTLMDPNLFRLYAINRLCASFRKKK